MTQHTSDPITAERLTIVYEPENCCTGIVSTLTWDNLALHSALCQAFHVKAGERIIRAEVTRDGIKAFFEYDRKESEASRD